MGYSLLIFYYAGADRSVACLASVKIAKLVTIHLRKHPKVLARLAVFITFYSIKQLILSEYAVVGAFDFAQQHYTTVLHYTTILLLRKFWYKLYIF